jgi:hypothetical protein
MSVIEKWKNMESFYVETIFYSFSIFLSFAGDVRGYWGVSEETPKSSIFSQYSS